MEFSRAANLAPDRPEPLVGLGNLYLHQDGPIEAVKNYLMALQNRSYGTPEIVYYNLGRAYSMDGDFPGPWRRCRRPRSSFRATRPSTCQIGLTLAEMGLNPAAEKAFRRTLEISPDSSQAQYQLGLVFMKDRRFEDAKSAFRSVVRSRRAENSGRARCATSPSCK